MLGIVIPFYKLSFFEATLQSLANQTDKRFTVYLGDDASPEDCTMFLNQFKRQFDFVYHRFETNLGGTSLTQQWQRCIALTNKEEWLMILGDDDILSENVVEKFYHSVSKVNHKRLQVIRYSTIVIDDVGEKISNLFNHSLIEYPIDSYLKKIKHQTRSSLSEYIFTRNAYLKYNFFDYPLAWHSDDRAWIEFSDNKPIYTINDSVIYIRVSDESITGRKDKYVEKNCATLTFFRFLLNDNNFTKDQNLFIMYRYEVEVRRYRKLSFKELKYLFYLYILNFEIISFLKFLRRMYLNLISKK